MNQTPYLPEQNPDKEQTITPYEVQMQSFHKLLVLEEQGKALQETIKTLNSTLALHIKQNIDTFQSMQDYIGEQMAYRLFRQGMEENNMSLELQKKNLELEFMEQKLKNLELEQKEEDTVSDKMRWDLERQKLEIENLKKNIDILENVRKSTKDKLHSVKVTPVVTNSKAKEVVILTAVGTATAAGVGGVIAFVVWLVRFYIQNTP